MRVKIYVELMDDERDLAHYEQNGFSRRSLESMYYLAVKNLVEQAKADDLEYLIDIEVED
ncbi:MAG: hypothetical protein UHD64_10035 [Bacteroidales bacterium]|nr:hypothetical protein [Bacteroidales bacterium]